MTRRRKKPPSYRLHKASGQAVVTINGKDRYLGTHGTQESRELYARVIAEESNDNATAPRQTVTISQLCAAFWRDVLKSGRYQRDGKDTGERDWHKRAQKQRLAMQAPTSPLHLPTSPCISKAAPHHAGAYTSPASPYISPVSPLYLHISLLCLATPRHPG